MNHSVTPSSRPSHSTETLMWIGEHQSPEFQGAFGYCQATAAQIALRRGPDEALRRPAAKVRHIVLVRQTRKPLASDSWNRLQEAYPQASLLELRGSLCVGQQRDDHFEPSNCCDWYQWNQVLPAWLGDVPSLLPSLANPIGSVAVIAAHPITAEPLMDVVASRGLAVVWCRQADPFRVRGVDAMLWDDTAATPTGVAGWRQRIADCGAPADTCVHAWFVQRPEICQYHSALQAGVRLLVSKPYDVRVFDWILADSAGGGQHSLLHQCNVGRSPKLVA